MKFNSLIPELTVTDIERTKEFYVNVLNFVVEYERPEDKFIFLSLEENQMMFEQDEEIIQKEFFVQDPDGYLLDLQIDRYKRIFDDEKNS